MVACAPAVLAAGTTTTTPATEPAAATGPEEQGEDRPRPSGEERTMRAELRQLERAWADGGGTFGYPFWEKARQRRAMRQITPSMYREYVTGYRDRLVAGCDLLDQVDTSTEVASEVRELVLDACETRIDALRATQGSLDEQIRRNTADPDVDLEAVDERIVELDAEAREAFDESWRDTRMAMDLAQTRLDQAGLERLREDAFL